MKIGVLIGSLRQGSYSKIVAQNLIKMLPESFKARIINIAQLAFYNEDLDGENPPSEWTDFRREIKGMDGYLFVTPEYNRSGMPALKNALDIASRPDNAWDDKPGAIISVSPGKIGGFGANHHFRQCMVFLNIHLMDQPEAYLSGIAEQLDDNGQINGDGLNGFLEEIVQSFTMWVSQFKRD